MSRVPEAELRKRLDEAANDVKVGAAYTHYKDPSKSYRVQGFVVIEATNQVGVVYMAEYGNGVIYVRPLTNWLDKVAWQGKHVPRFARL